MMTERYIPQNLDIPENVTQADVDKALKDARRAVAFIPMKHVRALDCSADSWQEVRTAKWALARVQEMERILKEKNETKNANSAKTA